MKRAQSIPMPMQIIVTRPPAVEDHQEVVRQPGTGDDGADGEPTTAIGGAAARTEPARSADLKNTIPMYLLRPPLQRSAI
jgi:hypothetical protein